MDKYIKLKDIKNALIELTESGKRLERTTTINIIKALNSLPTIEVSDKADRPFEYFEGYEDGRKSVEVSEGKWKGHGMFCVQCDQCGKWAECRTNYCPNCGALMEDPE